MIIMLITGGFLKRRLMRDTWPYLHKWKSRI